MDRQSPSRDRVLDRAHRVADGIIRRGGPATDAVLGTLDFLMMSHFIHSSIKRDVERTITIGPRHPLNQKRFAILVTVVRIMGFDPTLRAVAALYRASAAGLTPYHTASERRNASRYRADLLLLRWLRRYRRNEIPGILEAITKPGS